MNRDEVIAKDQQRRGAEALFKGQLATARNELRPRALASRLIQSRKRRLVKRADTAKQFASDNSRWLAAGALLSLLIAAGPPIFKRLNWRPINARNTQDQE